MTNNTISKLAALIGFVLASSATQAATVRFIGVDLGGTAWRTASDAKSFQINGSNIYGGAGYELLGSSSGNLSSLPADLTITQLTSHTFNGNGGYLTIDNPNGTGSVTSGVWYNDNGAAGTYDSFLQINLQSTAEYTVGIFTNNADVAAIAPETLRINQVSGAGAADSGVIANSPTRTGEWFFFDIAGVAGDSFVVSGAKAPGFGSNGIAAVTFDAPVSGAVPEPATWTMLIVGFGAVGGALRFRRRNALATA